MNEPRLIRTENKFMEKNMVYYSKILQIYLSVWFKMYLYAQPNGLEFANALSCARLKNREKMKKKITDTKRVDRRSDFTNTRTHNIDSTSYYYICIFHFRRSQFCILQRSYESSAWLTQIRDPHHIINLFSP